LAMAYGDVYVAHIAFGAKDKQTVDAMVEAAAYPGPSLVIAYSPCIAHGYDLSQGLGQQERAVSTGYWPLYRFDPRKGDGARLTLDSAPPKGKLSDFASNETRFRLLEASHPARAKELMDEAQIQVHQRYAMYKKLARSE
jgi:pyruvate-ferredoxin/flavodoxin oxidoreductase